MQQPFSGAAQAMMNAMGQQMPQQYGNHLNPPQMMQGQVPA
jgi:hypothetical protein